MSSCYLHCGNIGEDLAVTMLLVLLLLAQVCDAQRNFFTLHNHQRIDSGVLATSQVKFDVQCGSMCVSNADCSGYNVGPSSDDGQKLCELVSYDDTSLVDEAGWTAHTGEELSATTWKVQTYSHMSTNIWKKGPSVLALFTHITHSVFIHAK